MTLRDYQHKIVGDTFEAWRGGAKHVLMVMPTGAGKTKTKAAIHAHHGDPAICIAHRQELVLGLSMSLAELGLRHRILASKAVIALCIRQHIKKLGRPFYDPAAQLGVAGVDTLNQIANDPWFDRVQYWDIDEAHHVVPDNKWWRATCKFKNARGLGVTATPMRPDRKPLGACNGGMFEHMVLGPAMRPLIERGYLADYRFFAPSNSIDVRNIRRAANGDFNQHDLAEESHRSSITGDLVKGYLKHTPGALGITFVVDVQEALKTAEAYNAAGVRAEAVTGKTPDHIRVDVMERFEAREILQLVNVDLFGEGLDVPGVEVVSMGRPTDSYIVWAQQFGRGLRPAPGKKHNTVLDHVNNIRHGLPDREIDWTLESMERTPRRMRDDDNIPTTPCLGCTQPFEAFRKVCPWCGLARVPAGRSMPEQVEGDLEELTADILAMMRRKVESIDWIPEGQPQSAADHAIRNNHMLRQGVQAELRGAISTWAGREKYINGLSDSDIYRKFWFAFGVDVLSAQALGSPAARVLHEKIIAWKS